MEIFVRYVILHDHEGVFLGTHIDHSRDIDRDDDVVYVLWAQENIFSVCKAYSFERKEDAALFADTTLRRWKGTKIVGINTLDKYVDVVDLVKDGYGNYTHDMIDCIPCSDTVH